MRRRLMGRYAGGTATGDTEAGAAFARWVLDQDPDQRYLTGAVVRGEQTLGVKVQPNVTKGELRIAGLAHPGDGSDLPRSADQGDRLLPVRRQAGRGQLRPPQARSRSHRSSTKGAILMGIFDRLAQGPGNLQAQDYQEWDQMVGAAPPEQFGRATYDAVRQADPQEYYRHTQPGSTGPTPSARCRRSSGRSGRVAPRQPLQPRPRATADRAGRRAGRSTRAGCPPRIWRPWPSGPSRTTRRRSATLPRSTRSSRTSSRACSATRR